MYPIFRWSKYLGYDMQITMRRSTSTALQILSPLERKAVATFKKNVRKHVGKRLKRLVIFGSKARGMADEDSDLDILVVVSHLDEDSKLHIWDEAYYVFDETDVMISPLVLSEEQFAGLVKRERLIASEIERDGIVI